MYRSIDLETVDCRPQPIAIGRDGSEQSLSHIRFPNSQLSFCSQPLAPEEPYDFLTQCIVCLCKFSVHNRPLKLFCGDTVCSGCLLPLVREVTPSRSEMACPICQKKFTAKLNKAGYPVINRRFCRLRDAIGDLAVESGILTA